MKEENKKCWSCGKYKSYYIKGFFNFNKQKCGFCFLHGKITENQYTCEKWSYNHIGRQIRKEIALKHLIEILKSLSAIEQILKEEQEENKVNPI